MTIDLDLDLTEYHHGSHSFVGASRLRDFVEHGEAFFCGRYVLGTIPRVETKALIFGQAYEDFWQRGEEYLHAHYAIRPAHLGNGNTKLAKEWAAAHAHLPRLTEDELGLIHAMAASMRTCQKGMALMEGCAQQVTLRGTVHGLAMQSRPDCLHLPEPGEYGAFSVDIKTTETFNDFIGDGRSAVWKYGYHVQAALVRALLEENGYPNASCYLFVVEKSGAHRRACFQLPPDYLAEGDRYLGKHAPRLARCLERDEWPLGPEEIIQLSVPRWVQTEAPSEVSP